MRALVDAHSDSLLSELRSQKEVGLKMRESHVSDVEIMLSCLESFQVYCNQLMCSGSASSICRAVGSLNRRAIELEKLCDSRAQKVFIFPQLSLKIRQQRQKTLKEIAENLIGQIEADISGNDQNSIKSMTEASFEAESTDAGKLTRTISLAARISELETVKEDLTEMVKRLEKEVSCFRESASGENKG